MKHILFVLFFATASSYSSAQNRVAALLELGGAGLISVNAEYAVLRKEKYQVNLRAGFGYVPPSIAESYSYPVGGNLVYCIKNRHHIESGVLVAYTQGFNSSSHNIGGERVTFVGSALFFSPSIGYRYDKLGPGLVLRVFYSPLLVLQDYFDRNEIDEAYKNEYGSSFEPYDNIEGFAPTARNHLGWMGISVGYRF